MNRWGEFFVETLNKHRTDKGNNIEGLFYSPEQLIQNSTVE